MLRVFLAVLLHGFERVWDQPRGSDGSLYNASCRGLLFVGRREKEKFQPNACKGRVSLTANSYMRDFLKIFFGYPCESVLLFFIKIKSCIL